MQAGAAQAFRRRTADSRHAQSSGHRQPDRRWQHVRWAAVPGAGVRGGRAHRRVVRATRSAAAPAGGTVPQGLRGGASCARAHGDPSRHQAGQHPGYPRWRAETAGFRYRPAARPGRRSGRGADDDHAARADAWPMPVPSRCAASRWVRGRTSGRWAWCSTSWFAASVRSRPDDTDSPLDLSNAIVTGPLLPPSRRLRLTGRAAMPPDADVPADIDAIVMKALRRNPARALRQRGRAERRSEAFPGPAPGACASRASAVSRRVCSCVAIVSAWLSPP